MADWTEPLPDEAVEGETTHVEDHNKIVNALVEVRVNVNGIESNSEGKLDASEVSAALSGDTDTSVPRRDGGRIKAFTATDGDDVVNLSQLEAATAGLETDLDGKADVSHTHAWPAITGKPLTFEPATHAHAWTEITSKPATFPATAHTHPWADITGKPTTFTPATHAHTVADVTGLQAALDGKQVAGSYATTASVASKVTGIGVSAIWTGTIAQYDALTPDANTVYLIIEEA